MSEDVARALGANGARTVTIAGKECMVRPLSIQELTEVERDCVERYKRAYIKTYADCRDLLPEGNDVLWERIEEAAHWDVSNLPPKYVYNSARLKINRNVRLWMADKFDMDKRANERLVRNLAAAAMDQGMLDNKKYQEMTGEAPPRMKVPYVTWWITGSYEGMISFVWTCFRHEGVSREEVARELGRNPQMLIELSREIESLSAPQMGPEQSPPRKRRKAGRTRRS